MMGRRLSAAPRRCLWVACALLVSCSPAPTSTTSLPDPSSPYLNIGGDSLYYHGQAVTLRGENFNNEPALACCGSADIARINADAADYARVAGTLGGNYIRFGLEYQWYKDDHQSFFQVLDQQVQWAKQSHLWLIPVVFGPPGGSHGDFSGQEGFWSSNANQQELTAFWVDVATHYAAESTVTGFDLFNEPAPPNAEAWRAWAQTTTDAITKVDPNHFVVVEESSAGYSLPDVHGPRIVWSSHCYARVGTNGCNFPGSNHSSPSKRPFLIGEVGAKTQADDAAYVPDDLSAFNRDAVSWTHFVMRESGDGFGLYASDHAGDFSQPRTAVIETVTKAMNGSVRPS